MRDWSALVHRHLASARVDDRRRREIGAELAAHLEDAYDAARRSGCTEAEAIARAMEHVPDWSSLAVAVGYADVRATLGGVTMNQTGRELESILLLGLFYLIVSLIISGVMNLYNRLIALKER